MTFDQLQLSPVMATRAHELLTAFPSIVYLSGRRDCESQAHAMACHVATDRQWIRKTYLRAADLQQAVDQHPEATTVDDIQDVLYDTLISLSPDELSHVSDHLHGDAVDMLPLEDGDGQFTPVGQAVYTWIHDCPDTKAFLTREGGKVIWHWAVKAQAQA